MITVSGTNLIIPAGDTGKLVIEAVDDNNDTVICKVTDYLVFKMEQVVPPCADPIVVMETIYGNGLDGQFIVLLDTTDTVEGEYLWSGRFYWTDSTVDTPVISGKASIKKVAGYDD